MNPATNNVRFGSYEVLRSLGVGGMATVYLGRGTNEDGSTRLVAIKRLHDFIAEDPMSVSLR
jgi:eukaryotic-like serine/threonine-protein kinase